MENCKYTNMKKKNLYPDSLTPVQRSCVEKAFKSEKDSNCEGVCVWDVNGYMTEYLKCVPP